MQGNSLAMGCQLYLYIIYVTNYIDTSVENKVSIVTTIIKPYGFTDKLHQACHNMYIYIVVSI